MKAFPAAGNEMDGVITMANSTTGERGVTTFSKNEKA
jgi:hypothetical protein